jgi:hypothetical protein
MEMGETSPEEVNAVREQLREADEALHEALVMIDNLKALVAKLSSIVDSDEEGPANTEDSSRHPVDAISFISSD